MVYGFTEKFRKELKVRSGGVTEPQRYGKTYTVTHDPLIWREVADDLLEKAGVTTLFHTAVTGVIMDKDTFKGVVIESNAGQSVILAKMIVDASGDAALIARAGMDYYFGDNGRIQIPPCSSELGGALILISISTTTAMTPSAQLKLLTISIALTQVVIMFCLVTKSGYFQQPDQMS